MESYLTVVEHRKAALNEYDKILNVNAIIL
jgi:hypothetical protein